MSTGPLESFIKKYQTAKNYNSKEIRLTIKESDELSNAIALLLANVVTYQEKIIELQEQLLTNNQEINMSGGIF